VGEMGSIGRKRGGLVDIGKEGVVSHLKRRLLPLKGRGGESKRGEKGGGWKFANSAEYPEDNLRSLKVA